ncbi:peptidylprolyl isomerase [Altibacter sp.]|uniref:peptidylprolyl isomerase n=1 Tax=Altibacter sp. TaxID=2024823 RepID=UPI000C912404|nr:peptidylprolyl isomerase [Altibacter sp.]MAP55029.1 peptidylprolyl isomerase [Altibacter sp.]
MKKLLVLGIVCVGLLQSCEDKKNNSEEKTETTVKTLLDTLPSEAKKIDTTAVSEASSYPKITQKNVVSFLTEYGEEHPETNVRITTNHGTIDIQLYEDTPLHRANFVYLVKQDYFDNTFFHRVVKNFIIQGGNSDNVSTPRKRNAIGSDYLLPAEIVPGRKHTYGTVSGAKEYRENPDKQTAPFEFFIFLGPQTATGHLNGNYTIFGRVTKGMDVVEKIANLPADEGDWPLQNVYIQEVTVE